MDYIWAIMLLTGIVYGAYNGRIPAVSEAVLTSSKEAVILCINTSGAMALWVGLMEIANSCGLIKLATDKIQPFISFLFPEIPLGHSAREYITMNFIANFFGLNWGATPSGLKAMEALSTLNKVKDTASTAMCTFLIINISSLQLIPITIIAYRGQYGSLRPTAVIGPAIAATCCSTLAGIIFSKIMYFINKNK